MSSPLATALRDAAAQVSGYDVVDAAVATGRRQRRRARAGSLIAAVAVTALLVFAALPLIRPAPPTVGDPPGASLPDRLGSASWLTDAVQGSPPGAASLIFSRYGSGQFVTVGARNDAYRVIDAPAADAGRSGLISPDGTRVAVAGATGVTVFDLTTGTATPYPMPTTEADGVTPASWLPDGRGLVVLSTRYARDPAKEGIMKRLGVMDLSTHGYQEFAGATWPVTLGFLVAVSPDGRRIAYQYSNLLTVYDRATTRKQVFTLDHYTALAGTAAWAPDGSSLVLIQLNGADLNAKRWELVSIDPATGVERYPPQRRGLDGMAIIRLVGWHAGNPVVVGYTAQQSATNVLSYSGGSESLLEDAVERVGLYELGPTSFRPLLVADGVSGLDVATSVISGGLIRAGHPPAQPPPLTVLIPVAVAVVVAAVVFVRRRARPGSKRALWLLG